MDVAVADGVTVRVMELVEVEVNVGVWLAVGVEVGGIGVKVGEGVALGGTGV